MSEQSITFEKFFPRPLAFADKAHELEMMSKWNDAKITWETSLEAATAEANKRIAELEGEVKVLDQLYRDACENSYKFGELQANNNDLREALKIIAIESHEELWQRELAFKALSASPAHSLIDFENSVIEKCAKVCEEINKYTQFQTVEDYKLANEAARNIRALKQEVK